MDCKKVGIITFQMANNYGALLQNYGLQRALLKKNIDCETINYYSDDLQKAYKCFRKPTGSLKRDINRKLFEFLNLKGYISSCRNFNKFRKVFLNLSEKVYDYRTISNSDYYIYITGSDQVWNKNIVRKTDEQAFKLDFTDNIKISYAASCGADSNLFDNLDFLKTYKLISLREKSLYNIISNKFPNSVCVCDPVFLLSKEEWVSNLNLKTNGKSDYLYLYYVDDKKNETIEIAKYISSQNNYKIYVPKMLDKQLLSSRYGISCFSDGPIQFLEKIYNANFVVASSFHGVAFSIIFEKEFVTVAHSVTGSRVRDLLEYLGLMDRVVNDLDDYISKKDNFKKIDYKIVKQKLNAYIKESESFIDEIYSLLHN